MATANRNQPITIQVQHDGIETDSYTLSVNGAPVETKAKSPEGVNFQFSQGFVVGTYEFIVRADGPGGSASSDPVVLVVAPGAPSQPVIVIVVG